MSNCFKISYEIYVVELKYLYIRILVYVIKYKVISL